MDNQDLFDLVKDIVTKTINNEVLPLIKEIEKKCGQKPQESFKLKGVIRQKYVYVAGFSKKTTAADVGAYLEEKWPGIHFTVNDMRIKSYYTAFKVGFTQLSYDEMKDLRNWPEGLKVEVFRAKKPDDVNDENKQQNKLSARGNDIRRRNGNKDSSVPMDKDKENQNLENRNKGTRSVGVEKERTNNENTWSNNNTWGTNNVWTTTD